MTRPPHRGAGRRTAAFFAFLLLILGLPEDVPAWKEQMHKSQLTRAALDLIALKPARGYPAEIWRTYRAFIEQGAFDEDFPCCEFIRANNHYRHALSGRRLSDTPFVSMGDPDVDTLRWARSNTSLAPWEEFHDGDQWAGMKLGRWTASDLGRGNMSWEEAVTRYDYTDDSKRLAYYTLGFVLHLLQDMGCPEHVHDDPHGASGFNGFEMWVYRNYETGDRLAPAIGSLTPKVLGGIDDYFIDLSKIAYSANRFHGGRLSVRPPYVEPGSDLARMFRVEYGLLESEWRLANPNGTSICTGDYAWDKDDYERDPNWTKGHDNGEWWPTSAEIPGKEPGEGNDESGFYYLELSGDAPYKIDRQRDLYPDAFLPTPLEDVKGECRGWRQENTKGSHLYSLIGKAVFPPVIEYTAGLVEHYYDIVNRPPYVRSVEVAIGRSRSYSARFEDREGLMPSTDTVKVVESRELKTDASVPLQPGEYRLTVGFNEPVRDVTVKLGRRTLDGSLDLSGTVWSGGLRVGARDGFGPGEHTLSVAASDLENHFKDKGGLLDSDPRTPARRLCDFRDYPWEKYEPGEDRNHKIRIAETGKEVAAAPAAAAPAAAGEPWGRTMTFQGQIFAGAEREYLGQPGTATITIDKDLKVKGSFQISFGIDLLMPGTQRPFQRHSGSVSGTFAGTAVYLPGSRVLTLKAQNPGGATYDEKIESADPRHKNEDWHLSGRGDVLASGEYNVETGEGRFEIGVSRTRAGATSVEGIYAKGFSFRVKRGA